MYNRPMKIALAQINTIVGDIAGNVRKIRATALRAKKAGADLVVFPELAITGYPPRDLLELQSFVQNNRLALEELARTTPHPAILVGYVESSPARSQKPYYNAAALLFRGKIVARRFKSLLPTYDVFDESRHFAPARANEPILFKGMRLGVHICEDMWHVPELWPQTPYRKDPVAELGRKRADVFINLSSSPFHRGKGGDRLALAQHHVAKFKKPFLFVNQVGGNDELIFDGNSFAIDAQGRLMTQAHAFREDLRLVNVKGQGHESIWSDGPDIEQIHDALVLGLRDYTRKCGFKKVLLGLSGGIDSSVTAALAVRALGKENVLGVLMPSPFSSKGSLSDSLALAKKLGIKTKTIPISPAFATYLRSLKPAFRGHSSTLAEENLQARIRGTILMALSNTFGMLVLTTGNKSELSMGYCTLYGDMNGGLAVISDVLKTTVYRLGQFINQDRDIIPEACFTKPPSAELRPNQTDQDSLPPYDVLDPIVEAYVEDGKDVEEITAMGYPRLLVEKILKSIDASEYKRRQAAPGLRLTSKAFGMGRRMPIARGNFR
jgi:NAD+ synthase (glutamine-hydrolysing)